MAKKEKEQELPDMGFGAVEVEEEFDWENEEDGKEEDGESEEDEPAGSKPKQDDKPEESDDDDTSGDDDDDDEQEPVEFEETPEIVEGMFDALLEKMGIDLDEDAAKPKSTDELLAFFDAYIEESSKPEYSSDVVQRLDEFIKNGGDFEAFYKVQKEVVSYDNIDIEEESNQRQIVSDYLELSGYNAGQITKKIRKYEESGILKDEAEDALESVKKIKAKEAKQLEAEQARQKAEYDNQQKQLYTSISKSVEEMKDIRGVSISNKDKVELMNYMFKVQPNGRTKWQDEYGQNVMNMIESAFFTMKGDALISSAKKTGETSAATKFKKALASTKVSGTNKRAQKTGGLNDLLAAFQI